MTCYSKSTSTAGAMRCGRPGSAVSTGRLRCRATWMTCHNSRQVLRHVQHDHLPFAGRLWTDTAPYRRLPAMIEILSRRCSTSTGADGGRWCRFRSPCRLHVRASIRRFGTAARASCMPSRFTICSPIGDGFRIRSGAMAAGVFPGLRWAVSPHDGLCHALLAADVELAAAGEYVKALCGHRMSGEGADCLETATDSVCMPCVIGAMPRSGRCDTAL